MQKTPTLVLLLLLGSITGASALDNGLGLTPQMGWNSWNKFACDVNEDVIKQTADAIKKLGLDKLGYNYVNIDDCWSSGRDSQSKLIPDPKTFPSGIKSLSDYVHGLGLKLGIYSDAGIYTCAKRPGSLFYENIDAQTWAEWGVDYLKYDNCWSLSILTKWRYSRMRDALNKTGRSIFYSMCEWGSADPSSWAQSVGNSWRTTEDIANHWDSVMSIYEQQVPIASRGGIGGWNDPDMLEVGNGALSFEESQAHFALWALLKSPLILGNDIRNMDNDTLNIISNTEIIAINQDPLGIPASRASSTNGVDIWAGQVVDGIVVGVFNKNSQAVTHKLELNVVNFNGKQAKIRDLLSHIDLGVINGDMAVNVPAHGIKVYKLSNL